MKKMLFLLFIFLLLTNCEYFSLMSKKEWEDATDNEPESVVYSAGHYNDGDLKACYWKNKKKFSLEDSIDGEANAIYVVGDNVYTGGSYEGPSGAMNACYWINEERHKYIQLDDPEGANSSVLSIFVLNDVVFMAGQENSYACYWINNIKYPLKTSYPNLNSRATSIYVLQDSSSKYRIYIAGYFDNGSNNEACYWADFGTNLITLPVDNITLDSFAYSIFIYGDKIYTGGEYNNNPCYWGNNNLEFIPPIVCNNQSHIFVTPNGDTHLAVYSSGPSCVYFKNGKIKYTILDREVYSIYVFNDDVYIAGAANIGAGWHASYWKNEDDDTIFVDDDENIGSRINSIFVTQE